MAKPTKQVQRIMEMEALLNRAQPAVRALEEALEEYRQQQADIAKLIDYYTSHTWMKDYEAREAGKLPEDLHCGVLSEDAVYDLLTDNRRLQEDMLAAVAEYIREN